VSVPFPGPAWAVAAVQQPCVEGEVVASEARCQEFAPHSLATGASLLFGEDLVLEQGDDGGCAFLDRVDE